MYVATPRDLPTADILLLKQAIRNGVGVIEVDQNGGNIIQEALSQSLTGLRLPVMKAFPPEYRLALSDGVKTFLNGNPSKGCSLVYDEIEALTRKIANKTYLTGSWTATVSIDFNIGSWNNVTEAMRTKLNSSASGCPALNKVLLARVLGITEYRNQTGHKIGNKADLIKRDKELRTRFETATDLLEDLIKAVKPLKI